MSRSIDDAFNALERAPEARRILVFPDGSDVVLRDHVQLNAALADTLMTLPPASKAALGFRLPASADELVASGDVNVSGAGETLCTIMAQIGGGTLRQRWFAFRNVEDAVAIRRLETLLAPVAEALEDALVTHIADDEAFHAIQERVRHGIIVAPQRLRTMNATMPLLVRKMPQRDRVRLALDDATVLREYLDTIRSVIPKEYGRSTVHPAEIARCAIEDWLLEADTYGRALELRSERMEAAGHARSEALTGTLTPADRQSKEPT